CVKREPLRPIHLREAPELARARGPLDGERVALDRCSVEVSLERPGKNALACLLSYLPESQRLPVRRLDSEFLAELPPRRGVGLLVRHKLALWDRPSACLLPPPPRTAWMDQQHLEPSDVA